MILSRTRGTRRDLFRSWLGRVRTRRGVGVLVHPVPRRRERELDRGRHRQRHDALHFRLVTHGAQAVEPRGVQLVYIRRQLYVYVLGAREVVPGGHRGTERGHRGGEGVDRAMLEWIGIGLVE